MALIIEQQPLYNELPVGQQLIFTVKDGFIVGTQYKVKYVAIVESGTFATGLTTIGTFKTTPNNTGAGIFDFRPVLENEVNPDNEPETSSLTFSKPSYKDKDYLNIGSDQFRFPLHIVDKWSCSAESVRFFRIHFHTESSETATGSVTRSTNATTSALFTVINGVIQYDDVLTLDNNNYGYNMTSFTPNSTAGASITSALSNAPKTQYARISDYGTLPFLNAWLSTAKEHTLAGAIITLVSSTGASLAATTILTDKDNGGFIANGITTSATRLLYLGCFPANLNNWWSDFATHKADVSQIQIVTLANVATVSSETYLIDIICDNERGYEGIRLCWLNQWGAWDYYTFNKKSVRSTQTNRETYTQLGGTWNESTFKMSGYKGGKKNFRVNATERVTMNTSYLNEAEAVWMEELINSTEVYLLNGYDGTESSPFNTITNKYVEPVRVTTSSYIRKTIANDKLMQYTIEVEKSKTKRTQSV
tara:strand:+ start:664 stop:2097 length:1434 start_codon:yes stop_codon:yes gene_type:complete